MVAVSVRSLASISTYNPVPEYKNFHARLVRMAIRLAPAKGDPLGLTPLGSVARACDLKVVRRFDGDSRSFRGLCAHRGLIARGRGNYR